MTDTTKRVAKIVQDLTNNFDLTILSPGPENDPNITSDGGRSDGHKLTGGQSETEQKLSPSDKEDFVRRIVKHLTWFAEILEEHTQGVLNSWEDPYQRNSDKADCIDEFQNMPEWNMILEKLCTFVMTQFLQTALKRGNQELVTAVCRLLVSLAPRNASIRRQYGDLYGEIQEVFEKYIQLAHGDQEPLQSYAFEILSACCYTSRVSLEAAIGLIPEVVSQLRDYKDQSKHSTSEAKSMNQEYIKDSYCLSPLSDDAKQLSRFQFLRRILLIKKAEEYKEVKELDLLDIVLYFMDISETGSILLTRHGFKLAIYLAKKQLNLGHFIAGGGLQKTLKISKYTMVTKHKTELLNIIKDSDEAIAEICHLPREVCCEFCRFLFTEKPTQYKKVMYYPVLLEILEELGFLDKQLTEFDKESRKIWTPKDSSMWLLENIFVPISHTKPGHESILEDYFQACVLRKTMEMKKESLDKRRMLPKNRLWECISYLSAMGVTAEGIIPIQQFLARKYMDLNLETISDCVKNRKPALSQLHVLLVTTVTREARLHLSRPFTRVDSSTPRCYGFGVLLHVIINAKLTDMKVVALKVLHNCLAYNILWEAFDENEPPSETKRILVDDLEKIHTSARAAGVLSVLLLCLGTKAPRLSADEMRCLAVRCLYSMAVREGVAQIIRQLPWIAEGKLKELMESPVHPDKRAIHEDFCIHAAKLIDRVCGQQEKEKLEMKARQLRYSESDLLKLMKEHFISKGLTQTADILSKEAKLPKTEVTPMASFLTSLGLEGCDSQTAVPSSDSVVEWTTSDGSGDQPSSTLKKKSNLKRYCSKMKSPYQLDLDALQKQASTSAVSRPSLDIIVKKYLQSQSVACSCAMKGCSACKLSRNYRHTGRSSETAKNIVLRTAAKQITPESKTLGARRKDAFFKYSRFHTVQTVNWRGKSMIFTCAFHPNPPSGSVLMCGTESGHVEFYELLHQKAFLDEDEETVHRPSSRFKLVARTECTKGNLISNLVPSKSGRLILTAGSYCNLWKIEDDYKYMSLKKQISFGDDEDMIAFSNTSDDRLVGVTLQTAYIYDTNTGQEIVKLFDPHRHNTCHVHHATFDPTDTMVLADGLLWDVRSGKLIHLFDQLAKPSSGKMVGLFHPAGRHLVVQSQVYDARTFRIMNHVTDLEPCCTMMNYTSNGDALLAIRKCGLDRSQDSFIRTFDTTNYETIATLNMHWVIKGFAMEPNDQRFVMMAQNRYGSCHVYEFGRKRFVDEEESFLEKELQEQEEQRMYMRQIESPNNSGNFVD